MPCARPPVPPLRLARLVGAELARGVTGAKDQAAEAALLGATSGVLSWVLDHEAMVPS